MLMNIFVFFSTRQKDLTNI